MKLFLVIMAVILLVTLTLTPSKAYAAGEGDEQPTVAFPDSVKSAADVKKFCGEACLAIPVSVWKNISDTLDAADQEIQDKDAQLKDAGITQRKLLIIIKALEQRNTEIERQLSKDRV